MIDLSIFDVTVVTIGNDCRIIGNGAVVISGDMIFDVGDNKDI